VPIAVWYGFRSVITRFEPDTVPDADPSKKALVILPCRSVPSRVPLNWKLGPHLTFETKDPTTFAPD
jgi:hypothetical protein